MKEVGKRVKEYREYVNLSRRDFARIMGISYSLQMQIELGFKNASKNYINKFHQKFPKANIQIIFFD